MLDMKRMSHLQLCICETATVSLQLQTYNIFFQYQEQRMNLAKLQLHGCKAPPQTIMLSYVLHLFLTFLSLTPKKELQCLLHRRMDNPTTHSGCVTKIMIPAHARNESQSLSYHSSPIYLYSNSSKPVHSRWCISSLHLPL